MRRNASFGVYDPDGIDIAYLEAPQDFSSPALYLASSGGDRVRPLVEGDAISWPRWSPDGTRIVYADDGEIYIVEVATGQSFVVAEGATAEWFDDDTLVVAPGGRLLRRVE